MVKVVNSLASKLAEARKKVLQLEDENRALVQRNEAQAREIKELRSSSTRKITTFASTEFPKRQTRSTYDQPTKASRNRTTVAKCESVQTKQHHRDEVVIRGARYIYEQCRLVQISCSKYTIPSYMQETKSFDAKILDPWRMSRSGSSLSWPSSDEWGTPENSGDETSPQSLQQVDDSSELRAPREDKEELAEPEEPQLGESIYDHFGYDSNFYVSSEVGLDILRKAHRIVQEALYEAARKFWPWIWRQFRDGPHLVKLGRDELHSYIGETGTAVDLGLCGTRSDKVYFALMDAPFIRNAICHPCVHSFSEIHALDNNLEHAHRITLALRDEERSAHMRSLRDELRETAETVLYEIESFNSLAVLPFSGHESPPWKWHHERLFKEVLENSKKGHEHKYSYVVHVANKWALYKESDGRP
ncbi:hypothetical protein F4819DRAFT_492620 [Hypoxylon fuscum]|nr:hypothetical protein F4819DRAFT_492620 [Hypoxylon fuscum]